MDHLSHPQQITLAPSADYLLDLAFTFVEIALVILTTTMVDIPSPVYNLAIMLSRTAVQPALAALSKFWMTHVLHRVARSKMVPPSKLMKVAAAFEVDLWR
ncbi:hypothetical protein SCP_1503040 [Sparassis crispa]|uniref:Uncharacterized protein n=1 Tax=Sparassis crispa TaxID=139825 RepID=A0A401H4C3_9APHY|nr:hypothetical protein SCP_1503040 [Sparassis crispa]GBE89296.1 hypothetical protein SCP_1503040 [Sparassis crispa]